MANRGRFRKPTELYGVLEMYGRNLVTTEGDIWRIHRKIASPSFSEVWELFEATARLN